jgi:uncharacterized protein (DUF885 family)
MRIEFIILVIMILIGAPLWQLDSKNTAAKRLHELFAEDWQWQMEQSPETATLLGDNRYNDRLTDLSPEAIERRKAHEREMLRRVSQIAPSQLDGQDRLSYDLFLMEKRLAVEGDRFPVETMPITQMSGPLLAFGQLMASMPLRNVKDYQNYVARLEAFARFIDQIIAVMKRGIDAGWMPPAVPMRTVPGQIAGQIQDDPARSNLFKPFQSISRDVPESERRALAESARKAISESVTPALRRLHDFVKQTYLPACRKEIAAKSLPNGEAYYQYAIRRQTTTTLSARVIHETGLREVARIRKEMEAVISSTGFTGSFTEFLSFLRSDPRFYYSRAEDLVAGYRDISKRADAGLPALFAELPRNPYGVREIYEYEAPAQTTAFYQAGAADGSRPGWYWVNTYKLETRPKYEMEALTLHEAVPGHHLQISRAQELKGLPDFRRNAGYTAYVEGWALYAESLGTEMGFYANPYSKFGQLTYEMWRACRLVVDTGMHAFGWDRQRAIDFMNENTAKTENDIVVEVDRYIVWPGQALAYKLGELKIKELKARAIRELGEKFDVRKFHNALLDDGPLPLNLLEKHIVDWIAGQKQRGSAGK